MALFILNLSMIISKKFIKYLNNIIHHTYFNTIYNSDEQKQNIKLNLSNILKNNIDTHTITTICTTDLKNIVMTETRHYYDTQHKEIETKGNYIDLLFDQFIDLYKKSITLNNLFGDIYNLDLSGVLRAHHSITVHFLKSWDSIVFNNRFFLISDMIKKHIYNTPLVPIDLENVIYILKSKFNHRFVAIMNDIKNYRIEYYKFRDNYTLETYLKHFQEYKGKETELEAMYSFYNYIDFKDELVLLFFKTNFGKLKRLYSKCLDSTFDAILFADSYLYKNAYDDYIQLIEIAVSYIINNTDEVCYLKHSISVYNKTKTCFGIDTFKNIAEPLLNKRFEFIKSKENIENKLIKIIIEDIKQNVVSEYTRLLLFVDTTIFMKIYIKYLSKRIINNKINIKTELGYYRELKKYDPEELYKINLILDDVAISRSLNEELSFCKTTLITCRYMIWPIKIKETKIPCSFVDDYTNIKLWYNAKFTKRKLHFNINLLRCVILFNGYKLNIKGCYADILLQFNSSDTIKQSNISLDMMPFIRLKLIYKQGDYYHINDMFSSKHKTIKIN